MRQPAGALIAVTAYIRYQFSRLSFSRNRCPTDSHRHASGAVPASSVSQSPDLLFRGTPSQVNLRCWRDFFRRALANHHAIIARLEAAAPTHRPCVMMSAQAVDMRLLAIALSSRHRRPLIVYPRYRADCQQPASRRRHDCHVIAQTGWGTYKNQHVRVTHTDSQRRPTIIQAVVLGALSRYTRTPIAWPVR